MTARRAVLASMLALPAAMPLAGQPAAAVHDPAEAAFIATCDEWMRWEIEFYRVENPWGSTLDKPPAGVVAYLAEVQERMDAILDRLEAHTPRTLAGFAALAQLAVQDFAPLADGNCCPSESRDAWRLLRALGARYVAEYLQEERWHRVVPLADCPPPMSALARAYVDAIAAEPRQRATQAAMARARAAQLEALATGAT